MAFKVTSKHPGGISSRKYNSSDKGEITFVPVIIKPHGMNKSIKGECRAGREENFVSATPRYPVEMKKRHG